MILKSTVTKKGLYKDVCYDVVDVYNDYVVLRNNSVHHKDYFVNLDGSTVITNIAKNYVINYSDDVLVCIGDYAKCKTIKFKKIHKNKIYQIKSGFAFNTFNSDKKLTETPTIFNSNVLYLSLCDVEGVFRARDFEVIPKRKLNLKELMGESVLPPSDLADKRQFDVLSVLEQQHFMLGRLRLAEEDMIKKGVKNISLKEYFLLREPTFTEKDFYVFKTFSLDEYINRYDN